MLLVQNHEEVGGFLYLVKSLGSGRCDDTIYEKVSRVWTHSFSKPIILGPAAHRRCFVVSLFRFVSLRGFYRENTSKDFSLSLSLSFISCKILYSIIWKLYHLKTSLSRNWIWRASLHRGATCLSGTACRTFLWTDSINETRAKQGNDVVSYQETTKQYFAPLIICVGTRTLLKVITQVPQPAARRLLSFPHSFRVSVV